MARNTNQKTTFRLRIGHKISLFTSIMVVLAMGVFWSVTNYNTENTLRQQTNNLGNALSKQTALLVTESVLADDLISMNVILAQLTAEGVVEQAAILDFDNNILAVSKAQAPNTDSASSLDRFIGRYKTERVFGRYTAPISLQDSIAGYVQIDIDLGYIDERTLLNFLSISVALLLLLILAISTSLILSQHFTFPLRILAASMQGLRKNGTQASTCPGDDRSDEIGLVIRHYNYLLSQLPDSALQANDDEDMDNNKQSGRNIFISILSINLANYSALYDAAGPQTSAQLIERSYYQLVKVTQLYNGTIESFSDGNVIVTFGASQPDKEHSFHGICCAQLFLKVIDALEEEFLQQSDVAPCFKMGLHCSEVLVTSLSKQGNSQHTVIGDGIKIAHDICCECPEGALIISEDIFIHADADSKLSTEEYLILENTAAINPIKTFIVKEPGENYHQLLKQQVTRILSGD